MLDTSFPHRTWNNHKTESRVIFFFDFFHPGEILCQFGAKLGQLINGAVMVAVDRSYFGGDTRSSRFSALIRKALPREGR